MVNKRLFLWIAVLCSILLFNLSTSYADDVILSEDFEDCGSSPWFPDNGVWQCGAPTSGPGSGHDSPQGVGTILDGTYPDNTDSRLIGPPTDLPEVTGGEEIYLRFWQWFSYVGGLDCDWGEVQISVKDEDTGIWSNFTPIGNTIGHTSPWSKMGVELTAYAGEKVRIAFYHTARGSYPCSGSSTGWYIDDIEIIIKIPSFTGGFESGWEDWSADRGVWQIGTPTAGPVECHGGLQCAGTILDGNYPGDTDSRLIGPTIDLPEVTGGEEIYLRFWQWFSYVGGLDCDWGEVQISVKDEDTGIWSNFTPIGNTIGHTSPWSKMGVELTAYAGEKVRIAFYHTARGSYPCSGSSTGWYIDEIEIIIKKPAFTGDFESGWEDWSADRGVWQIGTPTAGPVECHGGLQCAGTILDGNHPGDTDSRLIGPTIDLPEDCADEIYIRFWHWFSYIGGGSCDYGQLQISVWDQGIEEWSSWENIGNKISDSSDWTPKLEILTGYAGEKVKIAFYHTTRGSYPCSGSSTGWYIDDIDFPGLSPVIGTSFDEYVVPPDSSTITVTANDPCGGNLSYNWDALDGGEISGAGEEVQFAPPPEYRFCPYRVRVAVISDLTHIGATKIAEIYTRLPGDADENGVANILDKVLVRNHFGQECDDPDWDPRADVNCDCVVNILDKVLVRKYFGQSE